MFLKSKSSGDLVELLEVQNLCDPCKEEIKGRYHAGEEMQDPETFHKSDLIFPSGESLPQCWLNPDYKNISKGQSEVAAI